MYCCDVVGQGCVGGVHIIVCLLYPEREQDRKRKWYADQFTGGNKLRLHMLYVFFLRHVGNAHCGP
jgi:hypothetical protein